MLSVRLPEKMERQIEILAERMQITKSELVKEVLSEYIKNFNIDPYEAGADLFGADDSDIMDGSKNYKKNVRRRIHEKYSD